MPVIQLSTTAAKYNGADLDRMYQGGEKIYEAIKVKPFNLTQLVTSQRPGENPVISTVFWTNRAPVPAPNHEYRVDVSYTGKDGDWIYIALQPGTRVSQPNDTDSFVFEGTTYYRHWQAFYITPGTPNLKMYWRVQQSQKLNAISGQLQDGTPHPRYGYPIEPEIPTYRMTTEITLDIKR